MSETFAAPFERLLADACPPAVVRQIECGGPPAQPWSRIQASGFLDALVPEAAGGAGLPLAEAFALFVAEGRYALPLPVAHTMLVRAALAQQGLVPPDGMIAIAPRTLLSAGGTLSCPGTPCGLIADWVLASTADGAWLLPAAAARRASTGVHGSLRADLQWAATPADAPWLPAAAWQEAGAALAAAQIAGALQRVLEMALQFANDRVQFGRSIGKFQAIQHQLAVMAEHVAAARMAAEIGCTGRGPLPGGLRAAMAKARASEAAALIAPLAHAVHGAIGVTAEFDLQLYTRRLHEWRADFGSEQHWNRAVGRALLAGGPALDFMRAALIPSNEEIRR